MENRKGQIMIYLKHPSKNRAVLLLVLFSLGFTITCNKRTNELLYVLKYRIFRTKSKYLLSIFSFSQRTYQKIKRMSILSFEHFLWGIT